MAPTVSTCCRSILSQMWRGWIETGVFQARVCVRVLIVASGSPGLPCRQWWPCDVMFPLMPRGQNQQGSKQAEHPRPQSPIGSKSWTRSKTGLAVSDTSYAQESLTEEASGSPHAKPHEKLEEPQPGSISLLFALQRQEETEVTQMVYQLSTLAPAKQLINKMWW